MNDYKIIPLKKKPIIVNIPHDSIFVRRDFKKDFLLSASDLDTFSKNMADLHAGELYAGVYKKTSALIARLSRIAVDTERFWINKDEPMAKVGMGALYEKNERGEVIRKISKTARTHGHRFYSKYHRALNKLAAKCLKRFDYCIILDCHTYPAKPRQYDLDKIGERPDICLGTDKFHTPASLINSLKKAFLDKNFSVKENTPFKGTMVPDRYFKNPNVFSLMIEVNRKVYMNERTHAKKRNFKKISDDVTDCILSGTDEFIKEYDKKRF